MNAQPASILDAQIEALLQRIAADRDRRCARMRASTEQQAHDLERVARREARAQVRDAVQGERKHAAQALRQAEAGANLRASRLAQQATRSLLTAMWAAVGSALDARWADPAQRKAWLQAAVCQAQKLLSERTWRIEHGSGWSEEERAQLARLAAGEMQEPREIELVCEPSVHAGIRIRTPGAVLDATAAGLLASRSQIESDFLAQYLALADGPGLHA